jgi:ABC-2 type transport system permease protein
MASTINRMPALVSGIKNQIRVSIDRPMFRFVILVLPVFNGLMMGLFYQDSSDLDFTTYAYIGSGIMTFWASIAFSSAADIQRERWYGTLEIIFACPAGFNITILGKIIGNTIWGVVSFIISFFFVRLWFNRPFIVENQLLFIAGILLLIASFVGVAFMVSGLFVLSRKARLFMNFFEHPIFLLSGVAFPVTVLPLPLRLMSIPIAPRWVISILRSSTVGESTSRAISEILILIIITVMYFIIGVVSYSFIDKRARVDANLGLY